MDISHFGPIALGTDKLKGDECIAAITSALRAGYRVFDTAQVYGNEDAIGEAIQNSHVARSEVFVITKISAGWLRNPSTLEEAYASTTASLRRLGLSYIDLILVHAPGEDGKARKVTWQALESLVEEGMVKHIGISNYREQHVLEMATYAKLLPEVIQIELHPWCQQRDLVAFCKQQGIQIQAYCPLARNQNSTQPDLIKLAESSGHTPCQLLLAYSLDKGWIPVVKSGDAARQLENLKARHIKISPEDLEFMDGWDRGREGAILPVMIAGGDDNHL